MYPNVYTLHEFQGYNWDNFITILHGHHILLTKWNKLPCVQVLKLETLKDFRIATVE